MIAHRGLSGIECENTCPAFLLAASKSYYGIETDVHVSKDGKFVICHDRDLARVAGGVSMIIEENDYADLKAVELVSPRMQEKRSDLVLPLLSDYLAICKKYNKRAILEIKTEFSEEDIQKMMAEIDGYGYRDEVTFISFHKVAIIRLKKAYPDVACQFLTGDATEETLAFLDEYGLDLDIAYYSLTKEYVKKVHQRGHEVNCWTVDSVDLARRFAKMGVDYITSNILE